MNFGATYDIFVACIDWHNIQNGFIEENFEP